MGAPEMRADLHCHSRISDGVLAPEEVVRRAIANGAELLALTDHDDLAGLAAARGAATDGGLRFLDGVEISATWEGTTVHIIGLGVDPADAALAQGLAGIRDGRTARARRMAEALAAIGIRGALQGAARHAHNPRLIGRTHFARFLVDAGLSRDVKGVFEHFLAPGKPGYVAHHWAEVAHAVAWIGGAGGVAVLAHPGRYRLGRAALERLLAHFRDCGGGALEVVSGAHTPAQVGEFARLARRYGFAASCGSDFHAPSESAIDVGLTAPLPEDLTPVWQTLV